MAGIVLDQVSKVYADGTTAVSYLSSRSRTRSSSCWLK